MDYKTLIVEKENRIFTITLNRPEKLNAMNADMNTELMQVIKEAQQDSEARVVIFTGTGRGFCSGADVAMLGTESVEISVASYFTLARADQERVLTIRNMPKPTIAAVNGVAIGMGLGLVLACDIIIASEKARFGTGFVPIARHPDNGVTYLLPQRVGVSKACELLLTGRIIDAEEADKMGLVNRVVPHDQLASATKELATTLARQAPLAVSTTKVTLYQGLTMDLPSVMELESRAQMLTALTEDAKEAINAFLEKREPIFKGR